MTDKHWMSIVDSGIYSLPRFSGDRMTPLAALSVCHVNLNASCDFHTQELQRNYLKAWRFPGPAYCGDGYDAVRIDPIKYNHLGINTEEMCIKRKSK